MTKFLFILLLSTSSFLDAQVPLEDWSDIINVTNEHKINTDLTEFSPTYWNNYIVYVGSRSRQKIFDKNHNEPYYDLYIAGKNNDEELDRTAVFSKILNSPYHEGPMTFSNDGKKIFFTRVDYMSGELNMNSNKIVVNKIFESTYSDNLWTEATPVTFNLDEYTSCHPSLSADGNTLIFSSNRPDGYGKMDLYITKYSEGVWSAPKNLGPEINTPENEIFPYLHDNDILLYSSNYNTNNNDLDIFKIRINQSKSDKAVSLPPPINTNYDDFGISINHIGTSGYFSSNRPSGKGKDDIYNFQSPKSILSFKDSEYNKVKITVFDQFGKTRISDVEIKICQIDENEILSFDDSVFDTKGNNINRVTTDHNGETYIKLHDGYNLISAYIEGKEKWQKIISTKKQHENISINLKNKIVTKKDTVIKYIEKNVPSVINNVELKEGATLVFNNIYYDYNSFEIKKGATVELEELSAIMNQDKNIKIMLSAHTDSRGDANYNQILSEKRAIAAKQYLISKGVHPDQVNTIGYGESKLRNHCQDGVQCSEAEHIYNRRTEVKVLKYK